MSKRLPALLLALLASQPAHTQDEAARVIDRIAAGEQDFLNRIRRLHPILETYLQETGPEGTLEADHYLLGKLDLREGPALQTFLASPAFDRRGRRNRPALALSASGFAQMVVPDDEEFNRATYAFEYVRREFLGDLRCLVFDVAPRDRKAAGRFLGRIWVEDQDYRIVRFNGTYSQSSPAAVFFHFDTWRVNAAPGWFVPAFIYIEDMRPRGPKERPSRLKGQIRLWGYATTRGSRWNELTKVQVEAGQPVRDRASPDLSPVESQRSWARQAEENVLDRLERSGLLAPKGEVDQVLDTVVNNLIVTNNLRVDVQCRVLLTTPLETFSLGRTIVVSRGLLDVLPDEASLAMVLSGELAHIVLGHRTETMFAFSDRTIFPETELMRRLSFARPADEVEAANRRAIELLAKSPYQEKLSNAGLFLEALAGRATRLTWLIEANLGNRLANAGNLVRLSALAAQAPAVADESLEQIAALPLGSRIRLDPWTNRISLMKTQPVALLSPREKMPFEITPLVPHLTRVPAAPDAQAGLLPPRSAASQQP